MKKIAEDLRKAELDTHQEEEKTNEEYFHVLYAPCIAGFSERSQKGLKLLKVGLAYKTGTPLFARVCKLKPPKGIDDQKDVVYHIPCKSCSACYIGETGQKFASRRYQHEYDIKTKKKKNGIGNHMMENKKILLIGRTGISLRLITIGEGRLRKLSTLTASTHRWKSTRESL